MKPEKIIETLEIAMAEVEWNYPMKYIMAFKAAIEAVKKQAQTYPDNLAIDKFIQYGYCPLCGNFVNIFNNKYVCDYCGQALKWKKLNKNKVTKL